MKNIKKMTNFLQPQFHMQEITTTLLHRVLSSALPILQSTTVQSNIPITLTVTKD